MVGDGQNETVEQLTANDATDIERSHERGRRGDDYPQQTVVLGVGAKGLLTKHLARNQSDATPSRETVDGSGWLARLGQAFADSPVTNLRGAMFGKHKP